MTGLKGLITEQLARQKTDLVKILAAQKVLLRNHIQDGILIATAKYPAHCTEDVYTLTILMEGAPVLESLKPYTNRESYIKEILEELKEEIGLLSVKTYYTHKVHGSVFATIRFNIEGLG